MTFPPAPRLSAEHVSAFQRDGATLVRSGFDRRRIEEIAAWAADLASRPEESGRHWVYGETSLAGDGRRLIGRIENLPPHHDGFRALADALAAIAGKLFGEAAILFKDKINFKMPGGAGFEPHQDVQAGWDAYARSYVNVVVAIDEATPENGCIEIAPRPAERLIGERGRPLDEATVARLRFAAVPMKPGDILCFDAYTPHRSAPNLSTSCRRLYLATFNRQAEGDFSQRYYRDKHASFPPDIDRQPDRHYAYRV